MKENGLKKKQVEREREMRILTEETAWLKRR